MKAKISKKIQSKKKTRTSTPPLSSQPCPSLPDFNPTTTSSAPIPNLDSSTPQLRLSVLDDTSDPSESLSSTPPTPSTPSSTPNSPMVSLIQNSANPSPVIPLRTPKRPKERYPAYPPPHFGQESGLSSILSQNSSFSSTPRPPSFPAPLLNDKQVLFFFLFFLDEKGREGRNEVKNRGNRTMKIELCFFFQEKVIFFF